jgi:hypothetical protein
MLDAIPERADSGTHRKVSHRSGESESPMELTTPVPLPLAARRGDTAGDEESSPTFLAARRQLETDSERTSPVSERLGQLPPSPPQSIDGLTEGVQR